jgi:hypothetical protein
MQGKTVRNKKYIQEEVKTWWNKRCSTAKQVQTEQAEIRFISPTDITERVICHESVITDEGLEGLVKKRQLLPWLYWQNTQKSMSWSPV